ncbi:MAG TPA: penicillin-binding transpeptidase domain-containing protein, partial [Solirubrobacteraceae bacterium]|nr:penicillin-binding transpeptidase domain-containing protein [Solirubrobacteraceae bacterium]
FAIVFFRLWFLQVLSGDQYLVEARENRTRSIRVQAPRGQIVDRSGNVLVDNRLSVVVQLEPQALPDEEIDAAAEWGQAMTARSKRPKGRRGEPVPIPPIPTPELRDRFRRLGRVLGMRPSTIQQRAIEQLAIVPYSAVTVRSDVSKAVLHYLMERKDAFPGVDVDEVYLRSYPRDTLAAQLLGYVGEISPRELKQRRNRNVKQGTIVGKAGLEYTYDRYLRGRDGAKVLRVDANGRFSSDRPVDVRDPIPGRQLRLSLDTELQKAGQEQLAAIGGGLPGAFVAMNPDSGEVYALGSLPTFDPSVFAKPITQTKYEQLTSDDTGAPLVNRAIGGVYATGSTFKPITALAALAEGVITPDTVLGDPGCIQIGTREACNAGKVANGPVALRRALQVSSDVYFYKQGINLFSASEEPLQRTAKRLGLGRLTGIDLPEERPGQIPGHEWRADINERERRCRKEQKTDYCGYALEIRPYNVGDNVNLAVGQGEIAASPLQMAVAYSAIVNGGEVPRPHLGLEIQDATGRLVQKIDPGEARRVEIPSDHRQAIMDGLAMAAQSPGGTSTHVFASWPHDGFPVYGKTGTAEVPYQGALVDQSWYVAYVRAPEPRRSIVLAVTVERGGFGADRAAPIACRMLRTWFDQPNGACDGASKPSAARRAD